MSSYNITYNTTARIGSHDSMCWLTRQHVLPFFTARVVALLLFLALACSGAWAQQTANHYTDTYTYTNSQGTDVTVDISNVSIVHKPAKWYSFRQEEVDYHDSFDAENSMTTTLNGVAIQATNTYVDTIYMHKGTSINIDIPQTNNTGGTSCSTRGYNLWYDFRTGGNLYCNYTNDGTTIYDLLTLQTTQSGINFYRFANGYAGGLSLTDSNRRLQHMTFYYPTDEEFEAMTGSSGSLKAVDNDYYVLACDVSLYKDFAEEYVYGGSTFGAENEWYEPTLCGRDMYYIIGVDVDENQGDKIPSGFEHYWVLTDPSYQGGRNTGEEHYLEEYEITFPAFHFSNYTDELVTLTKDAQGYAIPGGSDTSSTPLTVTFADNDNDQEFKLTGDGTISGTNRVIQFYYEATKTAWRVADGTTATILVTKEVDDIVYNIARYKLTFKHESSPLTQAQVDRLDNIVNGETVESSYWWDDLTERSYIYMNSNYHLLTSLKFDYSEEGNAATVFTEGDGGKSQFYAFPLAWDNCGYAFYDGCSDDDVFNGESDNGYSINSSTRGFTRWGMYSITNSYIADGASGRSAVPTDFGKHDTTYWMYIDASDRPGSIAELTFDEKLCQGSKLYVSGWLKSENTTYDDGAVLLTIMGVTKDETGNEVHTPIHRHCSGQIRFTGSSLQGVEQPDEPTPPSDITGKGNNHNQWCQFYFTFINPGNEDYDYYTLKVENYCASSTGGDFDIDDIEVYVLHPSVEMAQFDQICSTSGDEKSAMRLDIEYEAIMSRLGFDPLDYEDETEETVDKTIGSVDFVILNEAQYRNLLADTENPMTEEAAFEAALVTFYGPDGDSDSHQYPTLDFYCNYDLNTEYGTEGTNIIEFSGEEGYFYRRLTDAGVQYLSVDCLTDMQAYTEYVILLEPHTGYDYSITEWIELLDNDCAIKTEFFLSATTILKVNGETVDPTADYCAGQEFVISPEVTYTDENGNTVYLDGVYFDWFFGSVEEYTSPVVDENGEEKFGGVTLEQALLAFRTYYPDAEELSEATPVTGSDEGDFTKDHYDIIAYYLEQERYGGMNNMLVLYKSHLDMRVLNTGLELVIQPIEVVLPDDAIDICFAYVPLSLSASGDAPTLKAGFSNINYPENDYEPCLRLGLAQFEQCSETTPFTINLCKATYVTEEGVDIDHLGVAEGMDMLILVDTDDPVYRETILGKEDDEEIVIGKVARLYATTENGNDPRDGAPTDGSYMQIYFYKEFDNLGDAGSTTPFTVREGYYYVVSVYFQEKGEFDTENNDEPVGSACWGTFPLEMKIVPEYLVWTGDSTCNWNNDNHWKRADRSDIHKTAEATDDDPYPTNATNETDNGFVPMLFSKVIIPRDSEAELYMAGFIEDENQTAGTKPMLSWEGDEDTANHDDVSESPTSNIMYDMMLYETVSGTTSSFKTEHYRVNLCDQIHFEPGAQLLHSEQLIYNKAWTDVELVQGPWTLAATPLRDVVSGDWYTKKATGTETAEYFTDITFTTDSCDRYNPMVYQRNWSNSGNTIVYTSGTDKTVPAYASTGWSSVYNDASVSQQAGEGFSIKASNGGTSNLMFRFPKADESYDVATTTLTRENAGRLLISELVTRTDPDGDDDDVYKDNQGNEQTITVELTQTGNNYYIIGNPYTAAMSMAAFMEKNSTFVGYWTESTYGPIAGTKDGTSWGTDDCLIAPYSAFFVTTDESDINPLDDSPVIVTFTKDMQTFELEEESAGSGPHVRRQIAFSIRATGEGGTTSAAVTYADKATDDYKAGEDAVLMEDAAWKRDGMPLVYTVAGDKAVSVNTLKHLTLIPIGAFADEGSLYTLSFVGVDNLDDPALVDTYEDTETPLTEGFTLEVEGATHGRYYIRVNTPIMTDIEETESPVFEVSAYSPVQGTVVVSSDAGLESVELYSIDGMLLNRTSVGGGVSCTIDGVASGIAIVKVKTTEGSSVKKIRVR